jgi:hypothetical protein
MRVFTVDSRFGAQDLTRFAKISQHRVPKGTNFLDWPLWSGNWLSLVKISAVTPFG